MIILGIDPGVGRTGWGVISKIDEALSLMDYGCIETPANSPLTSRLLLLHRELKKVIQKYQPQKAGVEDLFFNTNAKTAIAVGQARGAIVLTLELLGIKQSSFTPLQIKQTVAGYGRAEKKQVQRMIKTLLHLNEVPRQDDAADALAVAITVAATSVVY